MFRNTANLCADTHEVIEHASFFEFLFGEKEHGWRHVQRLTNPNDGAASRVIFWSLFHLPKMTRRNPRLATHLRDRPTHLLAEVREKVHWRTCYSKRFHCRVTAVVFRVNAVRDRSSDRGPCPSCRIFNHGFSAT